MSHPTGTVSAEQSAEPCILTSLKFHNLTEQSGGLPLSRRVTHGLLDWLMNVLIRYRLCGYGRWCFGNWCRFGSSFVRTHGDDLWVASAMLLNWGNSLCADRRGLSYCSLRLRPDGAALRDGL